MATVFTSLKTKLTLIVGSTLLIGGTGGALLSNLSLGGGGSVLVSDKVINYSGALLPIVGNLTATNYTGNGTASGWSLQNPYDEKVLCREVTVNVTAAAAASPITRVDVYRGTGAISAAGFNTTSGSTLSDNLKLSGTGVYVLTGSLLLTTKYTFPTGSGATTQKENFVLDENGGTNDFIVFKRYTGVGDGLAADVHAECYSLD